MLTFEKIIFKPVGDHETRALKPLNITIKQMEEKLKLLSQREEMKENFEKAREKIRKNLNKPGDVFASLSENQEGKTLSLKEKQNKSSYSSSKFNDSSKLILLFLSLLQKNN